MSSIFQTARCARTELVGHDGSFVIVAIPSPDASMVVVRELVSTDRSCKNTIKDMHGRLIAHLGTEGSYFVWSPDSSRLIVVRSRHEMELFEVSGKRDDGASALGLLPGCNPMLSEPITFSQNSSRLLIRPTLNDYHVFDRDGHLMVQFTQVTAPAKTAQLSPDGNQVLIEVVSNLGLIIRNASTGQPVAAKLFVRGDIVYSACWAPDSVHIVVSLFQFGGNRPDHVVVWNTMDDTLVPVGEYAKGPVSMIWSPNGQTLTVTARDRVESLHVENKNNKYRIEKKWQVNTQVLPYCAHWSSDSETLAVIDGRLREVRTYGKSGNLLSVVTLSGVLRYPHLSRTNSHVFDMADDDFHTRSICLVRWTPITHRMFSRHLRKLVFDLMLVARWCEETGWKTLPRLPMELWLMVFEFLV